MATGRAKGTRQVRGLTQMLRHPHDRQRPRWRYSRIRASSSLPSYSTVSAPPEQQASRLRHALEESGPLAACLGMYLASRIDLLPAVFCRELALIPDCAAAIAPGKVRQIIAADLGNQWHSAFSEFDETPFASTLIAQSHQAKMRTGASVACIVLRPEFDARRSEAAVQLDPSVIAPYCGDRATSDLLGDFKASLGRKTNFCTVRDGLALMARDQERLEILHSPRTYPELCSAGVLTLERPAGLELEKLLREQQPRDALANRLCQVWLHLSLRGHCFPVDANPNNVVLLSRTEQVAFVNCDLVALPPTARENLANYFSAVLADDPDKATMYLLREMTPSAHRSIDRDSFRSSCRQAAYFGMLEPILGTNSNAMAQVAFQHWKSALEHGFTPKPHLLCFYRGLFAIARLAHRFALRDDPLREGLMELRMTTAFEQVYGMLDWQYWYENADKFASALVNLPRVLDEALSDGTATREQDPTEGEVPDKHGKSDLLLPGLLLLALLGLLEFQSSLASSGKIVWIVLLLAGIAAFRRWTT